jgi:Sensors of blue-light using FAD
MQYPDTDTHSSSEADMRLERLIYGSISTTLIDDVLVDALLFQAVPSNRARQITGYLMADARLFVQVFEGPRAHVRALWRSIANDSRHRCVVKLLHEEVGERMYADWSMGFGRASRAELLQVIDEANARQSAGHPSPWGSAIGMLCQLLRSSDSVVTESVLAHAQFDYKTLETHTQATTSSLGSASR